MKLRNYLFLGLLLPNFLLAEELGRFENLPTQLTLREVSKAFTLVAPSPALNKKGELEDMGQITPAEPCTDENVAHEINTDSDGYETTWCRAVLTTEQQKLYTSVDFKFIKLKDQLTLESIDIEYKLSPKEVSARLAKLYGKKPLVGDSFKLKTNIRGGVPGGDVTVWNSEPSDKRFYEKTLIVYNNGVAKQIYELEKLEDEDKFACPKGTVADSQRKEIYFKNGEDESSYSGYISYCTNMKGARKIATYENKVGFDKNGYLRRTKELAFTDTVYDPKSLSGPMWIWSLDSRKLMEKRVYKNGVVVSQEVIGKLPQNSDE